MGLAILHNLNWTIHIRERAALERASQLASLMGDPEICEAIRALAEESEKCGAAMGG